MVDITSDEMRLEAGMCLLKVGEKHHELYERFYRLDLKNNQIIATTNNCFKKEKNCILISTLFLKNWYGDLIKFIYLFLRSVVFIQSSQMWTRV